MTSYSPWTWRARSATMSERASQVTMSLSIATLICRSRSSRCAVPVPGAGRTGPPDRLDRRRIVERRQVSGVETKPGGPDDASHDLARSGLRQCGHDGDRLRPEGLAEILDDPPRDRRPQVVVVGLTGSERADHDDRLALDGMRDADRRRL